MKQWTVNVPCRFFDVLNPEIHECLSQQAVQQYVPNQTLSNQAVLMALSHLKDAAIKAEKNINQMTNLIQKESWP